MNRLYYFVFRNAYGEIVAIRAYEDWCENAARIQAERDGGSMNAFRVTRAVGHQRCMTFG